VTKEVFWRMAWTHKNPRERKKLKINQYFLILYLTLMGSEAGFFGSAEIKLNLDKKIMLKKSTIANNL
jgi:hypothetical protein